MKLPGLSNSYPTRITNTFFKLHGFMNPLALLGQGAGGFLLFTQFYKVKLLREPLF